MSDKEENTAQVKLLIDRRMNRVILAEAGKDFVDILFSFLTLPLGTIIRLVRKLQSSQSAVTIGCFNKLYTSVLNLPTECFRTDACKQMLLYPRNVKEQECLKLKVNLDCGVKTNYFICSDVTSGTRNHGLLSYYDTARCTCGKLMNREVSVEKRVEKAAFKGYESDEFDEVGEFFIADDLNIFHKSAGILVSIIHYFDIEYGSQLEERFVKVGFEEVLNLLKNSLTSKSALTDTFLRMQKSTRSTIMHELPYSTMPKKKETEMASGNPNLTMKIMRRKSSRKVCYAEATAEFVDLLFTFLTIPLYSALDIIECNNSQFPGCIGNLMPVVGNARSWQLVGVLPPLYSCHSLLPSILPQQPPSFNCYSEMSNENKTIFYLEMDSSLPSSITIEMKQSLRLMDPKTPNAAGKELSNSAGYMKRASSFLVSDDLVVRPLRWYSPLSLLKQLNGPFRDIEQIEVSIGKQEALCLLRESLFTSSALSSLLNFMEEPKQEKQ